MSTPIEFCFDFVSPTAYLAFHAAPDAAARAGAELVYKPFFLGAVMQATGNRPPGTVKAKADYFAIDVARCARHLGIAYVANPHFPFNTRPALRAAIGLGDEPEHQMAFLEACFRHAWGRETPRDLGDPAALDALCHEEGFDGERIAALANADENRDALRANTDAAIARGAFGAPTFFVGDEIFFGHDRLDYVARAAGA